MEKIIVRGGNRLVGKVKVEGAKNAVLPILAASLLASHGKSEFIEVPALADVSTILEVLKSLQADVQFTPAEHKVVIDASKALHPEAPFEYVRKMRASILVMGHFLQDAVARAWLYRVDVQLVLVQLNSISMDLRKWAQLLRLKMVMWKHK